MSEYTAETSFIDLAAQQSKIKADIDNAISRVLDHGHYIMGPEVHELEKQLAAFSVVDHAITCANGTDALTLVLMSWGIGPGDAVFVPSFTYVASAESVAQLGAVPYFVDVCPKTFNIDTVSLNDAIYECRQEGVLNPRAIIAVDLFGQICNVTDIEQIANQENLKVLVDSAQSFGSERFQQRSGSFGDATTTSFFPAKPLGCYGDGGAIFTRDSELADLLRSLRLHGKGREKYDNIRVGVNSRLDTIQAAILLEKLKIFPAELTSRNELATRYSQSLGEILETPFVFEYNRSSWAQYTVKHDRRSEFMKCLKTYGIPTAIYYPLPLHQQGGYTHYPCVSTGLKNSESLSKEVFSLPMHPYISETEAQKIISAVQSAANEVNNQ